MEEEESRPREDLDVDTEQKEAARERRREFVRGLRVLVMTGVASPAGLPLRRIHCSPE